MPHPSVIKQRLGPGNLFPCAWAQDMPVTFPRALSVPGGLAHGLDYCLVAEDYRKIWIDVSVVRGDGCNGFRGLSGLGPATTTAIRILRKNHKCCNAIGPFVVEFLSTRFGSAFVGSIVEFLGRLDWGDLLVFVRLAPNPHRDWQHPQPNAYYSLGFSS